MSTNDKYENFTTSYSNITIYLMKSNGTNIVDGFVSEVGKGNDLSLLKVSSGTNTFKNTVSKKFGDLSGGTLNFENVTLSSNSNISVTGGNFTIKDSNINLRSSRGNAVIYNNGATINIINSNILDTNTDGGYNGTTGYYIITNVSGTTNIVSGTISSPYVYDGIFQIYNGQINIGSFDGSGTEDAEVLETPVIVGNGSDTLKFENGNGKINYYDGIIYSPYSTRFSPSKTETNYDATLYYDVESNLYHWQLEYIYGTNNYVAKKATDETKYTSLNLALRKAGSDGVVLLKDHSEDIVDLEGKLDLNGFTLNGKIDTNKQFELSNGSVVYNDGPTITHDSNNKMKLTNVKIVNDEYPAILNNGSMVILNDNVIESKNDAAIVNNGILELGESSEEFTSDYFIIKGETYGIKNNGNIFYFSGTFAGKDGAIKGGIQMVPVGKQFVVENVSIDDEDYYGSNIEDATGFLQVGDNVYGTLSEALSAVDEDGTITLVNNGSLFDATDIDKKVTLDLNGYTFTFYGAGIVNTADLHIVDGSEEKNGMIYSYNAKTSTNDNATIRNKANLYLNCNIESNTQIVLNNFDSEALYVTGGKYTVNSGYFVYDYQKVQISDATFIMNNSILVGTSSYNNSVPRIEIVNSDITLVSDGNSTKGIDMSTSDSTLKFQNNTVKVYGRNNGSVAVIYTGSPLDNVIVSDVDLDVEAEQMSEFDFYYNGSKGAKLDHITANIHGDTINNLYLVRSSWNGVADVRNVEMDVDLVSVGSLNAIYIPCPDGSVIENVDLKIKAEEKSSSNKYAIYTRDAIIKNVNVDLIAYGGQMYGIYSNRTNIENSVIRVNGEASSLYALYSYSDLTMKHVEVEGNNNVGGYAYILRTDSTLDAEDIKINAVHNGTSGTMYGVYVSNKSIINDAELSCDTTGSIYNYCLYTGGLDGNSIKIDATSQAYVYGVYSGNEFKVNDLEVNYSSDFSGSDNYYMQAYGLYLNGSNAIINDSSINDMTSPDLVRSHPSSGVANTNVAAMCASGSIEANNSSFKGSNIGIYLSSSFVSNNNEIEAPKYGIYNSGNIAVTLNRGNITTDGIGIFGSGVYNVNAVIINAGDIGINYDSKGIATNSLNIGNAEDVTNDGPIIIAKRYAISTNEDAVINYDKGVLKATVLPIAGGNAIINSTSDVEELTETIDDELYSVINVKNFG